MIRAEGYRSKLTPNRCGSTVENRQLILPSQPFAPLRSSDSDGCSRSAFTLTAFAVQPRFPRGGFRQGKLADMPLSLDNIQPSSQLRRSRWVKGAAELPLRYATGNGRNTLQMSQVSAPFQPPFFLFVPWKEEGGDLIVFGCGPGHDQSYQKLVGRSQLSPKVRLFHPVAEMQRARAARSFSR